MSKDISASPLPKRQDKTTEGGTIVGTAHDSLKTYGLAPCIGMAAVGEGTQGNDKVLAHVRCGTFVDQLQEFELSVMANIYDNFNLVISMSNPDLQDPKVSPELVATVRMVNQAARECAERLVTAIAPGQLQRVRQILRQSLTTGGELEIKQDRSIYADGNKVQF